MAGYRRYGMRAKLTYANVMVTLLAFVVLAGGGAYAASQLGKNSVGTKQLKADAVKSGKVKDGTLQAADLAPGVLPGADAFQASGSVNYDVFSSSPFGSTVVSLDVPPGSYFATAAVQSDNVNNVAGTITCRLINGAGGGGSTATTRSQSAPGGDTPNNFSLSALFDVTAGQALQLQCSKSVPASGARINTANIVAVQVGDISGTSD